MAYKLKLPPTSKVHNVFYISQLKRAIGNYTAGVELPVNLETNMDGGTELVSVVASREVQKDGIKEK